MLFSFCNYLFFFLFLLGDKALLSAFSIRSQKMEREEFLKLVEKISIGIATDEEVNLYNAYFNRLQEEQSSWNESTFGLEAAIESQLLVNIKQQIKIEQSAVVKKFNAWYRIVAAAVILMAIGTGLYFYQKQNPISTGKSQIAKEIKPGGNNAFLILANGKKINLNQISNGEIVKQAGLVITKAADGQLVYTALENESKNQETKLAYNTIETPKGGQYQINLPDGTKVWLNAASSLKYPTQFLGQERKVELKGEGYFEVAKDKTKPFKVITDKQEIQVLGTHFNVNAYNDEDDIKTTLLEGSVRVQVNQSAGFKVLKPGQQSILKGQEIDVKSVDIDEAIAWKNGYFLFNKEEMHSAMRKLSRWYNIDVVYNGNLDDIYFEGTFSRTNTLEQSLEILELAGSFNFKIEGRRLIVIP